MGYSNNTSAREHAEILSHSGYELNCSFMHLPSIIHKLCSKKPKFNKQRYCNCVILINYWLYHCESAITFTQETGMEFINLPCGRMRIKVQSTFSTCQHATLKGTLCSSERMSYIKKTTVTASTVRIPSVSLLSTSHSFSYTIITNIMLSTFCFQMTWKW